MADVDTENEGDTNPQPRPSDASTNPIDPNEVPSLNDPIRFEKDDSDSEDEDSKLSYQGHGLPAIAMTKIQKVGTLEHNDTEPNAWKQALVFQLTPFALEWLLDSDIPQPPKAHASYERWKYWSRLVASWMYNQVDKTLQSKLSNLSKIPKYAEQMCELMSMAQGSDRIQTAFLEIRKLTR